MALKQVKNKIVSTQKTGKVTKAMEAVSAVKMRKSQEKAVGSRPYVRSALKILTNLAQFPDLHKHPFVANNTSTRTLVVLITSDKGLAGSVNSAVLKLAESFFSVKDDVHVIAVGKKAIEFARREKKEVIAEFTNISDNITLSDMYEISAKITEAFKTMQYGSVEVMYQNFISTFEQTPTRRKILPLDAEELHLMTQGVRLKKYSQNGEEAPFSHDSMVYSVEPDAEKVLTTLIPQLVQIMIYHSLLESKASEHSARMVAMKNATDKARDLTKSLRIVYNKERQAAITAEVSEITGGIEAMSG